ncbi:MAG TPA: hypothetical protein VGM05_34205 [Planctomycetaceae bacterium]
MSRWCCSFCGLLALSALSAGCAANRLSNPFGSTASKSSKSQVAKNDRSKSPVTAKGPGSPIQDGANGSSADDENSPGGAAGGGHDPETMAYINKELRDAAPEERANYLADFKGMHAVSIRQVLRGRRMAINHELASKGGAETRWGGSIRPVTGEYPPGPAPADASGVHNAVGIRDGQGHTGNGASPYMAELAAANGSPADPRVNGGANSIPVGHASGYRLGQPNPGVGQNHSGALQPPIVNGRPNPGAGPQSGPGSPLIQTAGQAPGPGPGAPGAAGKQAVVTIGVPSAIGDTPATAAAAAAAPTQTELVRLISIVEAEASNASPGETESQKQDYIKKQVDLRMLYLMSGQQERALQAIPGLDPADQEFWQQTFWGLTNYFDSVSIPSASDRAAQTVTQMQNAVLRLQEKAHLELRNVTFCHKISSFGNYEKYSREEFGPGQEVLLYAEVANIHSEPIPDGKFRTCLKSTLEILRHGPQGDVAERIELPETVDICRTHRRDYFHSYQFTIPAKLSLGPHVLKLTVEDMISRRVTTYSLNFMLK